jgi:hypothetical protein
MRGFVLFVAVAFLLTGCGDQLTGNVVSEHGCAKDEVWCPAQDECISPWNDYCPQEGEDDGLMTANDCEYQGGIAIDYGNGKRCSEEQKVIGEVAGLLSLHVCCHPRPDDWQGY